MGTLNTITAYYILFHRVTSLVLINVCILPPVRPVTAAASLRRVVTYFGEAQVKLQHRVLAYAVDWMWVL